VLGKQGYRVMQLLKLKREAIEKEDYLAAKKIKFTISTIDQ